MKDLIIHVHDLTVLVTHDRTPASGIMIVDACAHRAASHNTEMPPAEFVSRFIAELVQDSRLQVLTMARFEVKPELRIKQLEVDFESLDTLLVSIL